MSLSADRLARWSGGRWFGTPPAEICGIGHDSRSSPDNSLFIAIRGSRFDGHRFISSALEGGAVGVIVDEEAVCAAVDCPCLLVDDTRQALLDMARGFRDTWTGTVYAVTGSVGKTTVKEMTADLLELQGPVSRSRGNWNNDIGLPLSILNSAPAQSAYVFELGMNHPGEIARLADVLRPERAIMTTIAPVHLEAFNSLEDIAREKASLFEHMLAEKTVFMASDEPFCELLEELVPAERVSVALEGSADYSVDHLCGREVSVHERKRNRTSLYKMPLPGEYVVRNSLRAIAVAREAGIEASDIAERLAAFRPLEMRWECTPIAGAQFIDDSYNANPVSMAAAIKTFLELPCRGCRWLVLGGMRELGADAERAHWELGRLLSKERVENLILVGELGWSIADGIKDEWKRESHIFRVPDPAGAVRILEARVGAGDLVLLKASRGEHLEGVIEKMKSIC